AQHRHHRHARGAGQPRPPLHAGAVRPGESARQWPLRGDADRRPRRTDGPGPQVRVRGGRGRHRAAPRYQPGPQRRGPAGGRGGPDARRPDHRQRRAEGVHAGHARGGHQRDHAIAVHRQPLTLAVFHAWRRRVPALLPLPLRARAGRLHADVSQPGDTPMDFSRFFIDRPIFAAVLSIMIFAAGLVTMPFLPISEYPEVVPPSVMVRTVYPGANPKVIADTVATPLEEAINGVEGMMYLKSVAGSDGVLQMTVTFRPGTDPDDAAVKVQNRVSQALARLPEDVRRQGVTTAKQSPTFLMVVHLTSPNGTYDTLYLRNYARLHIKDALGRIPGVGEAQIFGGGDYAMRAWLDPDRLASRGLTAGDVVRAMREQSVQV